MPALPAPSPPLSAVILDRYIQTQIAVQPSSTAVPLKATIIHADAAVVVVAQSTLGEEVSLTTRPSAQ
jgi:hypothetical protein